MKKIAVIFHDLSLTTKLSLVSAILIFCAFFGISYFNYKNARKALQERIIQQELPLLTESIYALVQKELESPITTTEINAQNSIIIDWILKGGEDNELIYEYLAEVKKKQNIKTINLIIDKTGNFYNETGKYRKINSKNPKDNWYFDFKKSKNIKEFNISYSKENILSFFINHKIFDKKGNFLGVTAIGLPIDHLIKTILSKKIGQCGEIYLINPEGFVKVHQNKNLIHKNNQDLKQKNIKYFAGVQTIANKILTQKNGDFEFLKGNDLMLMHVKFIPEFNWLLLIEVSETEILAPVTNVFVSNVMSGALVTMCIFVIMILFLRWLVLTPLKVFENGVLSFFDFLNRKTNEIKKINLYYEDELGTMAKVINENIEIINQGIQKDNALIAETVEIIDIVSKGILTQRLNAEGQNPELNNLKFEINEMLQILENKVGGDINQIIEVMHDYQSMRFDTEIQKAKGEIELKVNEMGRSIFKQHRQIEYQNKEILTQKEETEEVNKQIKSSIQAAKTIQKAILPYQSKLDNLLKNYFVIYKPKDDVSGDFFWLNSVENNKIILIVADCTGHGVPGAFMTLIGATLLDKIVRVWNIHQPNKILDRLHDEIWTVLRQEETNNHNGMDVSVLCIEQTDENNTKITFSGAKHDLLYIKNDQNQVETLKGTRKSVGGIQNRNVFFENQEVILPKNSWFFIGSDGFEDQCNAERRKFGRKKIIELLEKYQNLSPQSFAEQMENSLRAFSEGTPQRDDILYIGVKI